MGIYHIHISILNHNSTYRIIIIIVIIIIVIHIMHIKIDIKKFLCYYK